MSMFDYIEKKRLIVDLLSESQYTVSDEDFVDCLLQGLNVSYAPLKIVILVQKDDVGSDELAGLLLQEEERIDADQKAASTAVTPPATPPTITAADYAVNSHGRGYRGRSRGRQSFNNNSVGSFQQQVPSSGQSQQSHDGNSQGRPVFQICNWVGYQACNCYNRFDDFTFLYNSPPPKSANYSSPSTLIDLNWYVDSGATHHVTKNMQNLSLKSKYGGHDQLEMGDEFTGHVHSDGHR